MKNQLICMHFNRQRVSVIHGRMNEENRNRNGFSFHRSFELKIDLELSDTMIALNNLIAVEISHNIVEMSNHDKQLIINRRNNGNLFQFI